MMDNNKTLMRGIKIFLTHRFNLDGDQEDPQSVVNQISKSVEFRGTNLWILIFAIIIASVGLNVNSTAVVIGAMLISPLMGPIMGVGLSLGINDFELFKRSFKNLVFAMLVSIVASALYFYITPLSHAESELLSRTTPTIWDVLIATFGGLAGIVAQTRKDKISPVIPGVAIATALMPPLCTAGYGLATGNLSYFGGAFYLFFINAVFIAFSTFFMVRFLKFPKKQNIDPKNAKKVRHYMILIVTITIVPSIIMAYSIVKTSIFEHSANKFVVQMLKFEDSQVINKSFAFNPKSGNTISVSIIGSPLSEDVIETMQLQLLNYGLENTKLIIRQANSNDQIDNSTLENLLNINTNTLIEKNKQIISLKTSLEYYTKNIIPSVDIAKELKAIQPNVSNVLVTKGNLVDENGVETSEITICFINLEPLTYIDEQQKEQIESWLIARTKSKDIKLIIE